MQSAAAAEETFLILHGGTTACGGGGGEGGRRGGWHHPLHPDSNGGGGYRRSLYPSLWLEEADDEEEEEEGGVMEQEGGGGKVGSGFFGLLEMLPQDALICVLGMLDAKEMARLAATNSSVRARVTGQEATWPWLQVCLQARMEGGRDGRRDGGGLEGRRCVFCFSPAPSLTHSFPPSLLLTGMGSSCYYALQ